MRFPPAEVLATFPKPNYVDPEERGPGIMIVELTLLPIALLCVALRLWVRIKWLHKSWWDDWLMLAAMVSAEFELAEFNETDKSRYSRWEPPY
jgi:hypothetical protein